VVRAGDDGLARLRAALDDGGSASPDGARVLAPFVAPPKMVFVGLNYQAHLEELPPHWKATQEPFIFSKLPSAIIGPGDEIRIPSEPSGVDYEVEFAVVIGRTASRVSEADALSHVWGYTLVNDVTERRVQATDNQITLSKGLDTFCPMGPVVVTADEIPDPNDVKVRTTVNGEVRQDSSTSDLIFSIGRLIERLSWYFTLEPGCLIATGSPAGCGAFLDPPVYLQPGDEVTVWAEGIGELTNPLVLR